MRKVWTGPVDAQGQLLYPGGYPLGSEFNWSNATSANLSLTAGGAVTPASFITSWLRYFAFEKDLGPSAVTSEKFTAAFFAGLEKLAPFWDATALQQPTPWLGKFDSTMIWCNSRGLDCTEASRRS